MTSFANDRVVPIERCHSSRSLSPAFCSCSYDNDQVRGVEPSSLKTDSILPSSLRAASFKNQDSCSAHARASMGSERHPCHSANFTKNMKLYGHTAVIIYLPHALPPWTSFLYTTPFCYE